MSFIQMNVPLVFWGRRPPSHKIMCICRSEERKGVATGSQSGQICLWDVYRDHQSEKIKLRPRCLLFGGISAIKSLCFVKTFSGDRDRIASLSEKGTVSVWDGKDGACLKYIVIPGSHTGIKALSRTKYSETLLVLYGRYSSIHILDAISLDTLCVLRSSCKPNWNAQISFLISPEKKDHLLSLTVEGVAKMWLLPTRNEMKELGEMSEEKTTNLSIQCPVHMTSSSHGGYSTTLIVCSEVWQIYNTTNGHVKLLMIRAREESVTSWAAGEFIDYQTILVWDKGSGRGYVYRLSARCVPGLSESDDSLDDSNTAGCSLVYTLAPPQATPNSSHLQLAAYMDHTWCCQGDHTGRLYLWNIQRLRQEPPLSHSHVSIPPDAHACVGDSWQPPAQPCGLTDMLYPPSMYTNPPTLTCAVYLAAYGRLVCGQEDGSIAVLSATQAATVLMLQPRKFCRGWPQYCILKGHRNRVNHLLYPSAHSSAYHSDYLLSGGADFTVKLWDLFHGDLIHTFAVHGGGVKNIVTCPPEINPRLQTCVCSIAEDYSVAILSTSERKCLLVAAVHSSPVRDVAWRLRQDFLLVSCTDGKLYVWQIETGSLDRCVEGETAKLVLSGAQDTSSSKTSLSSSTSFPLQVRSLQAGEGDSLIQVLVFDPQSLINRLGKMDNMAEKGVAQPKKQADAFRTWLSARRNFGAGAGPGGVGMDPARRRTSAPAVVFEGGQRRRGGGDQGNTRPETERAREVLGQAVASQNKIEQLQEEAPVTTLNIVRLLLSCLHAWSLDQDLDRDCEEVLGLVRPSRPVSFGLLSKGQCLSLVLPGWNLKPHPTTDDQSNISPMAPKSEETSPPPPYEATPAEESSITSLQRQDSSPSSGFSFDKKYHIRWQLSRSLTTQHLLTMVTLPPSSSLVLICFFTSFP
ncbi:WD repeat-containing protein 7 [Geodia barretti]|uniref:WD repeat-containing protein 7 n=1 Tax=Geodia barretti TaxID=519541 RepID=A0AA35WI17_GEOBA|nr:WD repeat-containing protein 7 [Geodia barretti]